MSSVKAIRSSAAKKLLRLQPEETMSTETQCDGELPIFTEDWDAEPEANHLVLVGGMAAYDEERMAAAYKAAGDMLTEAALRSGDRSWEVAAPILFLYRHAVELYLKRVVRGKKHHDISKLIEEADRVALQRAGESFPDWAKARLLEFANHDPRSTAFRYANGEQPLQFVEHGISLPYLRRVMGILAEGLTKLARLEDAAGK